MFLLSGENAIVIVAGANMLLKAEDLQNMQPVLRQAKVLICQLEISPQVSLKALRMAREAGGKSKYSLE